MSSTNIQPTREEKRAKLVDLGLMQFLDGEWCFSAKAGERAVRCIGGQDQ